MDKDVKNYLIRMAIAFTIYGILLFGSVTIVNTYQPSTAVSAALVMLPVLPAIAVLFIIVTFVKTRDEVQQRIITEAILWGVGVVGIATFTYGFLEAVTPLPRISMIWVLPALIAVPGIAQIFVRMRYS